MNKLKCPDQLDIVLSSVQLIARLEQRIKFGEVTPNEIRRVLNFTRRNLSKLV